MYVYIKAIYFRVSNIFLVAVVGIIEHNEHVCFSSNWRLPCTLQCDTNISTKTFISDIIKLEEHHNMYFQFSRVCLLYGKIHVVYMAIYVAVFCI